MNTKQLQIVKIATTIICLMFLFPPYKISNNHAAIIENGYSFIFDLPNRAVIDIPSLLIQWFGVALISFACNLIYGNTTSNSSKK